MSYYFKEAINKVFMKYFMKDLNIMFEFLKNRKKENDNSIIPEKIKDSCLFVCSGTSEAEPVNYLNRSVTSPEVKKQEPLSDRLNDDACILLNKLLAPIGGGDFIDPSEEIDVSALQPVSSIGKKVAAAKEKQAVKTPSVFDINVYNYKHTLFIRRYNGTFLRLKANNVLETVVLSDDALRALQNNSKVPTENDLKRAALYISDREDFINISNELDIELASLIDNLNKAADNYAGYTEYWNLRAKNIKNYKPAASQVVWVISYDPESDTAGVVFSTGETVNRSETVVIINSFDQIN